MDIAAWIVFGLLGLVVGVGAQMLSPRRSGGVLMNITLGVVGALAAGWLSLVMGVYQRGEPAGIVMAVVGAVILIGLYLLIPPVLPRPRPPQHLPLKPR